MQPGVHDKIIIAQPREHAIAPTTLSTPDYISLIALMCLPVILFTSILSQKVYRKHRTKLLKQQITKLERAWYASYQSQQDT